jgi:hypothetical protein
MADISDEVRKVATALAKQNRDNPDYGIEVSPGFKVPQWLLYVSEAQRMIFARDAMK